MKSAAVAVPSSFIGANFPVPDFPAPDPANDLSTRRPPLTASAFGIPGVRPATALEIRPAPEMVPFGIAALDELTGGVPRGALMEMVGPASSGRTSVMMSLMAMVTRRQEVCAVVDASDGFDPASAIAAGVDLERVLWVRCGKTGSREPVAGGESAPPGAGVRPTGVRPADTVTNVAWGTGNAERVHRAITSGCFESAHGRHEPAAINKVAPPAKNISWTITSDYDRRLRYAMRGEDDFAGRRAAGQVEPAFVRRVEPRIAKPALQSFAELRRAKWDRLDQALKATDLLLQSGGFGLVIVDLGDISAEQARRIPLTSWFRFRRVVENTPTILLVVAKDSCAKTCASLVMQMSAEPAKSGQQEEPPVRPANSSRLTYVSLLDGLKVHVELVRTRLERKAMRSVRVQLKTETAWRKQG